MSEQLPAPDFDAQSYERPNQKWICGHAAEGQPCRSGPDTCGRCLTTAECVPVLEKKFGETKGRWRCTRTGGECETGPRPDGNCCRPISKCSPVPTLRTRRQQLTRTVVAATVALLLIGLGGSWRGHFINPGPLSTPHSSEAFAKLHAGTNQPNSTCAACHRAGALGPSGIVSAAWRAASGPMQILGLAAGQTGTLTAIDASCQKCHANHSVHQPNMVRDISCSLCHAEHLGVGPIAATTDAHCTLCHGDAATMAAAAAKGASLPPEVFQGLAAQVERSPGRSRDGAADDSRPAVGFTQIIHSFAKAHPEFRVHSDQRRDQNTLKFNHALHLTGKTIPVLPDGQKLDCAACPQPDAAGIYFRRIHFESHCQVCHSLQFDPETPGLTLPHGDADFVRAFLRSLPKQYVDFAARSGLTPATGLNQFAQEKLQRLQARVASGEDFERRVFFSTATLGPEVQVGTVRGPTPALYPGCAYCHEVKSAARGKAEITRPVIVERWLVHGRFNHAQHSSVACTQCHPAATSHDTADIILPMKDLCVTCHSPEGGVADSCATCHVYHQKPVR
jgi:predicted CXXCH cytochrome family protein